MQFVQLLPTIIVLLLIVATMTLFVFWLGQPSRKKLRMAQFSLGYLFLLNALLAITTNMMVYKDPASVGKSPLSLLMMLLPLGVGVLLYRAGCRRQGEIPVGQESSPANTHGKPLEPGVQTNWKILDNTKTAHTDGGQASPRGKFSSTWLIVLFLLSALAYAPAMFMLDTQTAAQPSTDSSIQSQPSTVQQSTAQQAIIAQPDPLTDTPRQPEIENDGMDESAERNGSGGGSGDDGEIGSRE